MCRPPGIGAVAQLGERLVRNEEVRGSIPLGSTSLRPLRGLRLGKPAFANFQRNKGKEERRLSRRSPQGEGGLRSHLENAYPPVTSMTSGQSTPSRVPLLGRIA